MDRIWSAQRYPLSPTDRVYGPQGYAAPSASHADIVASIPSPACAVTASVAPTSGSTAAITGLVPGPTSAIASAILIQASFSGGSPAPTSVVHVSSSGADSEIDMFDSIPAPVSVVGVNLRSVASILELMPAPVSAVTATNAPATDEEGDWFDSIPPPVCQIAAQTNAAISGSINALIPPPTAQINESSLSGAFIQSFIPAPDIRITGQNPFSGSLGNFVVLIPSPQASVVVNAGATPGQMAAWDELTEFQIQQRKTLERIKKMERMREEWRDRRIVSKDRKRSWRVG